MKATKTASREWAKDVRECLRNAEYWVSKGDFKNALLAAQEAAASAATFESVVRLLDEATWGNPTSGVDRCECGAKYWEGVSCVSCGEPFRPE